MVVDACILDLLSGSDQPHIDNESAVIQEFVQYGDGNGWYWCWLVAAWAREQLESLPPASPEIQDSQESGNEVW